MFTIENEVQFFCWRKRMLKKFIKLLNNNKGATAIEYALIASLIAVVAISGMKLIGNKISMQLTNIANAISEAGDASN